MVKAVYVLVSREEDLFYEMFLLSLHSLRVHDPGREVEVVLDPETYARIVVKDDPVLRGVRFTETAIPPDLDGLQKSRYLKTRLRSLVDGDYLYIDTDTIVCAPLSDIEGTQAELAAVSNENGLSVANSKKLVGQCRRAGFTDLAKAPFYNGGVLFVRDSDVSRRFYDRWHGRWLQSLENGVPYDQPALCQANLDTGCPIRELHGKWNCQIGTSVGLHYFKEAVILHYYGSISWVPGKIILPHVKQPGGIDAEADRIARDPKGLGAGFYHPSHFGKLKMLFSHFLFRLTKHPRTFVFFQNLFYILGQPFSWFRGLSDNK